MPRRITEELFGKTTLRTEPARGIVADVRPGCSAKDLGKIANFGEDWSAKRVEDRSIGKESLALRLRPLVHPVVGDVRAQDH